MLGTVTGNPSRNDLATFGGKIPERSGILVINHEVAISAKSAYFPSVIRHFSSIKRHLSPLQPIPWPHLGLFLLLREPYLPLEHFLPL